MSKREYIIRYLTIIKKVRLSGSATFEEFDNYLNQQSDFLGYRLNISKRTFQRDLDEIRAIFNLDIKFNFSTKVYSLIDEPETPDLNSRMLEAFDLFNSLNVASGLSNIIQVEQRKPQGTEHLNGIIHAIKNKLLIEFDHKKFWDVVITKRKVEPYFLKEFRNRWYMIARDLLDSRVKSFGLDRIDNLIITRNKFIFPKDFSVADFYKYSFGIVQGSGKPETIVLSFTPEQGKYLKSLPLHSSQRIVIDSNKEFRIEMTLRITHDLLMELLSYSNEMTVLKPLTLRKKLNRMLKAGLTKNAV